MVHKPWTSIHGLQICAGILVIDGSFWNLWSTLLAMDIRNGLWTSLNKFLSMKIFTALFFAAALPAVAQITPW